MKVGFCGSGAWGITLANLIANNGHEVLLWSIEKDVIESLRAGKGHPRFPEFEIHPNITYTTDLKEILDQEIIVECVTAKGLRPVCEQIQKLGGITQPFILTSKGIEQETGLLLVEVAHEVLEKKELIGYMSGPTLAKEVMRKDPSSAVAASPSPSVTAAIKELFCSPKFRIDVCDDVFGVSLGGAVKNVIAIATGLSEGAGYGFNTKAILITRGLAEMRELAKVKGAQIDTCLGLSGIGDLIVTGVSNLSRNFQFGELLGQGNDAEEAKAKIGMVVEGAYTVRSAYDLGKKYGLHLPITNAMYEVIYESKEPKEALHELLDTGCLVSS